MPLGCGWMRSGDIYVHWSCVYTLWCPSKLCSAFERSALMRVAFGTECQLGPWKWVVNYWFTDTTTTIERLLWSKSRTLNLAIVKLPRQSQWTIIALIVCPHSIWNKLKIIFFLIKHKANFDQVSLWWRQLLFSEFLSDSSSHASPRTAANMNRLYSGLKSFTFQTRLLASTANSVTTSP